MCRPFVHSVLCCLFKPVINIEISATIHFRPTSTVTRSVPDNSKATAARVPASSDPSLSSLPSGPVQRTLPKALGFSSQASTVITKRQRNVLYGLMVALAASLILWPRNTIISLVLIITAIYLATSVYRLYLAWTGLRTGGGIQVGADETNALIDDDLPSYTLLVPLYRETSVLPGLTKSLGNLDYPKDKIEIFLLLEEDDLDTIAPAICPRSSGSSSSPTGSRKASRAHATSD